MEEKKQQPRFPMGKREIRLGIALLAMGVLTADFLLYGGFNLGFAVMSLACLGTLTGYLLRSGRKLTPYPAALLIISGICSLSLIRSDDGFVKLVMVCFSLGAGALGLCLLAGQNRQDPAGILSLLDACRVIFDFAVGKLPESWRGVEDARKNIGTEGKKRSAVFTGLLIAVPVLAVLILLLSRADAAFEGLLGLLPTVSWTEPLMALFWGLPLGCLLYTAAAALNHHPSEPLRPAAPGKWDPLTVNTVLIAVCGVYGVYLFSQLAYFVGGFSGILPEEFTMAEYARRGFFEMAWLSAINLLVMTAAVGLSRPTRLTRWLCLFIGVVTVFFVVTASGKMLLYIRSYGLTRLRLLTEVIMVFLALTTVYVSIWLFVPKMPYMKFVMLTALALGALTAWADVDTVVAACNVTMYQSGALKGLDVNHLSTLSLGAAPWLERLADSGSVAARNVLDQWKDRELTADLRGWNIALAIARSIFEKLR